MINLIFMERNVPKQVISLMKISKIQTPLEAAQAESKPVSGSSAERSLRLLALLAHEGRALSLAELAARLALPKGTVHRLCTQLVAIRFLARDVNERSFVVGPAMRQMAFDTLNHDAVRGLRHGVMAELVRQVGETCNFTTLDGAQVLYLDRVEAKWPLRLTLDIGSHVPLHCTASGKLFLAQMPRAQRDVLIDNLLLTPMTHTTLTTAAALRLECDEIFGQGYSCDREEFMLGLIAVAVPVCDRGGAVRAAIAVHAPTARMSLDVALRQLPHLQAAAARMRELI